MKKNAWIIFILGILFLIQSAGAQTWTATKRLTYNSGDSYFPAIALDSNDYIHVVWYDDTPRNYELYYKKSTDGGATWTTKRLTYNPGETKYPSLAIDSNDHIHLVWGDSSPGNYDIYYKKSTNGGTSWTTKRLTYSAGDAWVPFIKVDSNNHIHVSWHDNSPGDDEIYYKKSTDGGTSWTTKRLTYNSGNSIVAAMAIGPDDHIHIAWHDETPGNDEIYYKKSTDGGATWTTKRLSFNSGGSWIPSIAVDSSNHIHVTWYDTTPGNEEIYYKRSTDGGASWTTRRLTYSSGHSRFPKIAADLNNRIHVVWYDQTPGNDEIFHKRSTDGGTTWTTKRISYSSGYSQLPTMATDSNDQLYVIWEDDTPGNLEILLRIGIQ